MTTISQAYEAGRRARTLGHEATTNPHDDWELGVAWAAGWHGMNGNEYGTSVLRDLVAQNRIAGLYRLFLKESCYPRARVYA